jgi:hypothetical protein
VSVSWRPSDRRQLFAEPPTMTMSAATRFNVGIQVTGNHVEDTTYFRHHKNFELLTGIFVDVTCVLFICQIVDKTYWFNVFLHWPRLPQALVIDSIDPDLQPATFNRCWPQVLLESQVKFCSVRLGLCQQNVMLMIGHVVCLFVCLFVCKAPRRNEPRFIVLAEATLFQTRVLPCAWSLLGIWSLSRRLAKRR